MLIIRPPTEQHSIITFLDATAGEVHTAPSVTDPTFERGHDVSAPLGDWFSRPLRIASIPWSEGTQIAELIAPWHEYFTHPEVYAKIKGFSRLRCKLHVKLLVNASPFQYSLGVMSYRPLAGVGSDGVIPFSGGALTGFLQPTNDIPYLMSYTQMPHAHFEPQYSKGCELELPFIYHSDWVPLTAAIPSFGEDEIKLPALSQMGALTIASYAILRTAGNASANPITVSLYAWATDVELAGPSMVLQSKDEYSAKPISSAATAIAAAAGKLEAIPAIAPFARATGAVASGLGALASAFGFSNPPVIDPVHNVRINYAANLTSTDIPTQVEKLSLDPKNELCVDARTVGLDGVDHMSIRHILDRNVFFTSFQWNASDVPDQTLYSQYVNPAATWMTNFIESETTTARRRQIQMTPAALMSTFFRNWRGPITLKFVAAASQFHRGRLRIAYDPAGPWPDDELGSVRLYQKVWDLATSNTFEYTIPFMAATSWLKVFDDFVTNAGITDASYKYWIDRDGFPSVSVPFDASVFNGALRVEVLSELTAPSAVSVPIFVYINCADVEFANPAMSESVGQLSLMDDAYNISLQSADTVTVKDDVVQETVPIIDNTNHRHEVYMGEAVVSLRNLVHRAVFWDTVRPSFVGAASETYGAPTPGFRIDVGQVSEVTNRWVIPRLPMPYYVNAPNDTRDGTRSGMPPWSVFVTGADYRSYGCNARTTPLSLINACYAGWRGSMVWRAFVENNSDIGNSFLHKPDLVSVNITRGQLSTNTIRRNSLSYLDPTFFAANVHHTLQDGALIATVGRNPFGTTSAVFFKNKATSGEVANARTRSEFAGTSKGTPQHVPTVDAILPHYSGLRMMSSNPRYYFPLATDGTANLTSNPSYAEFLKQTIGVDAFDTFNIDARYDIPDGDANLTFQACSEATAITLYVSAGVDYTGFMFLAVPTILMYVSTPTTTTLPPLVMGVV